ncbi:MAG: hypothetical protein K2N06_03955 [Oscillospiraceae bacterium]|nr:hypothetical protein [Oscillospiraceae bacterium]
MKIKKTIKTLLIVCVVVIVLLGFFSIGTYNINVAQINNGKAPLFIFSTNVVNDGGTRIYKGLGYHIIEWSSYIENVDLKDEHIKKALENSNLSRLELEELSKTNIVYVRGWDIAWGYDDMSTIKNGPGSEHTVNLHFEFDKLN